MLNGSGNPFRWANGGVAFHDRVRKTPQPLVVFAHGNAELIDYQMPIVKGYQRLGFAVALFEYRGYGRSDGQPGEEAIVADGVALLDRLLKRKDIDPARIVYHGRSLGGGVLASLSNRRSPAVLILESTFRSVTEMARGMGLPAAAVRDPFDTQATLVKFEKPVLVCHGRRDQVVPVSHGQVLAEIAPNSTLHILECGHNDCPPNPRAYWQIIHDVFAANGLLEPKS